MAYITDVERELRVLLDERNDAKTIAFVKTKVLESYRNGMSLRDSADANDIRKAKRFSNRLVRSNGKSERA